jgi:hypothetical protein
MKIPIRPLRLSAAGVCALALAACGCTGGTGTVTGKVTYIGKALPGGTVTCLARGNRPFMGKIEPDGTYTVTDVPIGPVKIAVEAAGPAGEPPIALPKPDQPPPQMKPPASDPRPPHTTIALPKQYANPDTSGLEMTVVKGSNPFPIDLK